MRKIPLKLRRELEADPYYMVCARKNKDCRGRITWEHAFIYAGKQINERFAIIPLCFRHHLGDKLVKVENEQIAVDRATELDKARYPRLDWQKYERRRRSGKEKA